MYSSFATVTKNQCFQFDEIKTKLNMTYLFSNVRTSLLTIDFKKINMVIIFFSLENFVRNEFKK